MALSVQLRELAERILALGAGVERANAKGGLAYLVTTNLPTIIAALKVAELVRDEDWLAERISDSLDVDWRPIDAARAIIAALPKETDNG